MKRESSRDKPYDAIAGLQAATLEVGKMALLHGADRLGVAARPSPVIVGVFRVCHIAKHSRLRGVISFTLILATRTKSYVAIAGQSGSHVSVGDLVFIKADMPENNGWRDDDWQVGLDLVILVPQGINADISDGSGDTKIFNVGSLEAKDGSGDFSVDGAAGSVRITDGSGSLRIENISGDVTVNDGSGDIDVRSVSGSFVVESDGSGGIHATDVKGSVIVEHDGSGSIDVNKVGKDFRVESKGGGSIDYSDVTGRVDIPERHRDRRYRSGR